MNGPLAPEALQDLIGRFALLAGGAEVRVAEHREVSTENEEGKETAGTSPSGWTLREFEELWELLSTGAKQVLTELAKQPSGYPDPELESVLGMDIQRIGGYLSSVGRRMGQFRGKVPIYRKDASTGWKFELAPDVASHILHLSQAEASTGGDSTASKSPRIQPSTPVREVPRRSGTRLSDQAQRIYDYLRNDVLPGGRVVTYADVHQATGVPLGEEGGYLGQKLGEIFHACDALGLPPITSIVVRQGEGGAELYDTTRRHGMPAPGYFRAMASSPHRAGRPQGLDRWIQKPPPAGFDADADRWAYRKMVEEHQDRVWRHRGWPRSL